MATRKRTADKAANTVKKATGAAKKVADTATDTARRATKKATGAVTPKRRKRRIKR